MFSAHSSTQDRLILYKLSIYNNDVCSHHKSACKFHFFFCRNVVKYLMNSLRRTIAGKYFPYYNTLSSVEQIVNSSLCAAEFSRQQHKFCNEHKQAIQMKITKLKPNEYKLLNCSRERKKKCRTRAELHTHTHTHTKCKCNKDETE